MVSGITHHMSVKETPSGSTIFFLFLKRQAVANKSNTQNGVLTGKLQMVTQFSLLNKPDALSYCSSKFLNPYKPNTYEG